MRMLAVLLMLCAAPALAEEYPGGMLGGPDEGPIDPLALQQPSQTDCKIFRIDGARMRIIIRCDGRQDIVLLDFDPNAPIDKFPVVRLTR